MVDPNTNYKEKVENVTIIGGGPAGLAAAVYTARANLNPLVFAGSPPGGQLMLTSDVENYPGYESILGPDLMEKYRSHAKKFGVRIIDQNVQKVDFSKKPFEILLPNDGRDVINHVSTKSVIIATGAKALWLNLANEQRLRGKGVSACATCDGFFFKDKIVAVVGGGDTAMEETLTLTKFASKIYLIHRRDQFRASKIMQNRVFANKKIEILWNTTVEDVIGEQKVEGLQLKSVRVSQSQLDQSKTNSTLRVNGLFLAIGHKPDTDIFAGHVELDSKGYIITSARKAMDIVKTDLTDLNRFNFSYQTMTSVAGAFAAGDCVDYIYRQAGTAVGMGIEAALDAEKWLEE